ncbi:MAG TPA: hypothetical protein VF177_06715 [Anaerolineae bacterium]
MKNVAIFTPQYTIAACPPPDIIVLPGGDQRQSAADPRVIGWIQGASEQEET